MNYDFDHEVWGLWEGIKSLFDKELKASLKLLETEDTDGVRNVVLECLNSSILVSAQEILALQDASLFLSVEVSTRIFGRLLGRFGGDQLKSTLLQDIREGNIIGTVALSEKGMNIEGHPFETAGKRDGDGYRVMGKKDLVMSAAMTDWIAVAGKIGDTHSFFLVQKDSEGMKIGPRVRKLGYDGVSANSLELKNCFVPSDHVIGPFDHDRAVQDVRLWEDQVLTAAALGLMKQSLDSAVEYAKTHESGGKPIIAYQEVGFKLAEMFTLYQTSQLLAYRAAWLNDREAGVVANCAKVFCGESAEKIASEALQILGITGYTSDNPAEEGFRNAKYLQIAGTSTEISRMKIADDVLMMML